MSVHSVSGANTAWQALAEMRAARAAAVEPATDGAQGSAWSSATQGSAASGSVTGATPPPPPPSGVLQFFQQLQSVDGGAPGTTPTATSPSDASSTGTDSSQIFADLQALLASLQQGGTGQGSGTTAAGSAQGPGGPQSVGSSPTVTATGPTDPSDGNGATATQTGNDLALQLLGGLPGAAWQLGVAQLVA